MSIIDSFDNKSKPLVDVSAFIIEKKNLDYVCIVSFSIHVLNMFLKKYQYEIVGQIFNANGLIDIYLFETNDNKFLFYMSPIGASAACATIYEVHCGFGPTKFVVFGSCGILDYETCKGKLIIPSASYRDEGLSYHYMELSDYVDINNYEKVKSVFEKYNLPYVIGKSWTTDAPYMETINKANKRRSEGCICVEMESAGIQALCNFYGIEFFTFFFGADILNSDLWEKADLGGSNERNLQEETFSIAIKVAKNI